MKAIVKKIKAGTEVTENNHFDNFTPMMVDYIGKVIKVEPMFGFEGWYTGTSPDNDFNYHSSWLTFEIKKPRKKEIRTTQRWYKPSERLPDKWENVLVLTSHRADIVIGWADDKSKSLWHDSDGRKINVLLWSPMIIPKL